ncbi:MAG TPA: BrnT family toxin [Rhizomicrobium sp.]|nr:BrnT family toxin [Rhizomicrobium sp.]
MELEWDDAKSERTRKERGFGFENAALIFAGPVLEWEDQRRDWGEIRTVAVGVVEGRFLTVIYTERNAKRRIISARPARRKEKALWLSSAKP